jgi:outer membrane protein OmpA-like peptidoglycan-associated protein
MYMTKSTFCLITGIITVVLALPFTGCATRGYVRAKIAPVNTKVDALEAKTNEMTDKEQTDVSRLDEKIGSTDARVAELAAATQQANASAAQANASAAQANQLGQKNESEIAANSAAEKAFMKSFDQSLVLKADVTFGFNKSNLDNTDKASLDAIIQQVQSMPRVVFELVGFTDKTGSKDYNLALSQRRAHAVERYLVHQGIPLRGIHIVGLGEEPVPQALLADAQVVDPNATSANSMRLARRVLIRVYAANSPTQSASTEH